jgi:hypothetical protein
VDFRYVLSLLLNADVAPPSKWDETDERLQRVSAFMGTDIKMDAKRLFSPSLDFRYV